MTPIDIQEDEKLWGIVYPILVKEDAFKPVVSFLSVAFENQLSIFWIFCITESISFYGMYIESCPFAETYFAVWIIELEFIIAACFAVTSKSLASLLIDLLF